MSLVTDAAAIRTRFLAQWTGSITFAGNPKSIQTIYQNGQQMAVDESLPYVTFSIIPGDNERLSLGANALHSQLGRVWLQIFVPVGEGASLAMAVADTFKAIFENWTTTDGAIRFSAATTVPVTGDAVWHQVNVSVPYESIHRQ